MAVVPLATPLVEAVGMVAEVEAGTTIATAMEVVIVELISFIGRGRLSACIICIKLHCIPQGFHFCFLCFLHFCNNASAYFSSN